MANPTSTGAWASELAADASRRLAITAVTIGAAFILYTLLYATLWVESSSLFGQLSGAAGLVLSFGLAIFLSRAARPRKLVAALGLTYEVLLCFIMSTAEFCGQTEWPSDPATRIAWMNIVIILFPFIVPARPKTMLLGSLAAASVSPVAIYIGGAYSGLGWPSTEVTVSLILPSYLCALVAYFPSQVINRLGAEITKARQLGSYELIDRLGDGGMGEVWRARHRMLVRPAAVKVIRPEVLGAKSPEEVDAVKERFEREAQATSLLTSPHSIELYDFGIADDGTFYYVMELLEGIDLESLVAQFGPQPVNRVLHMLIQACDSLADAHEKGLVHRDIKPANLHLSNRSRHGDFLKVLDFGLVKDHAGISTGGADVGETNRALVQGTPSYLAPESITGDIPVDGRADLYALGCVAFYLLSGRMVFEHDSPMKMAVAHAAERPPRLKSVCRQQIPSELDELVATLLAKDPGDRVASALELELTLEELALSYPWTPAAANAWWREHAVLIAAATAKRAKPSPTLLLPGTR